MRRAGAYMRSVTFGLTGDAQQLAQYYARELRRAGDVVEMRCRIGEQAAPGIGFGIHGGCDLFPESAKYLVQDRAIQRLLVLKVIVKQGFVDAGGAGDLIRAS